jgi:CSLREA domain-containing protein
VSRTVATCTGIVTALALLPGAAGAATISVNTTADNLTDDQICTLREAVQTANTNAPINPANGNDCTTGESGAADTIALGVGAFDLAGSSEDMNASGDLDVGVAGGSGPLIIDGVGQPSTSITGPPSGVDRAIDLRGFPLTVQDLTLDHSILLSGNGAGIRAGIAGTSLAVVNSAVSTNQTGGDGAGIYAGAGVPLTISGSTISGNSASFSNGGGGVRSSSTLLVTNSEISGNSATNLTNTANGGGIRATGGPVTIESSLISDNHSLNGANGGGLSVGLLFGTDSAIRDSQVMNNTAPTGLGGGIDAQSVAVEDSTVSGNSAHGGGGILASGPSTLIARTTLSQNHATTSAANNSVDGGGIAAFGGGLTIEDSSIVGNDANGDADDFVRGGGISDLGPLTVTGTRISGNTLGGGMLELGGGTWSGTGAVVTIANSTISGNAADVGGGMSSALSGSGQTSLVNVTMNGNIATNFEAIDPSPSVTTTLRASIIDNGSGACGVPIISAGFNLDRGSSCNFAPPLDLENVVGPIIGPLIDNGGPTRTHALPLGSPALDLIPLAECNDADLLPPAGVQAVTEDQRGYPRPFPPGGACDAGSYELFTCDGVAQNPVGPFTGCPTPPGPGTEPPTTQPPTTQPDTTQPDTTKRKKCKKKKKHKHRAAAAKKHKKKCKHKKRR